MQTVYTDRHKLRDAKTELYAGQLVPPFECPARAEIILKRVRDRKLGPVVEPEEIRPMLAEQLEKTARDCGFDGAVVVRGEEGMTAGDIRLEWGKGAIQRSQADVETRLDEITERWLAAPTEDADPIDPAAGAQPGSSAA